MKWNEVLAILIASLLVLYTAFLLLIILTR